ncbi:hypothetical protein ACWEGQ_39200, partial [Streptomyces seoulensis]
MHHDDQQVVVGREPRQGGPQRRRGRQVDRPAQRAVQDLGDAGGLVSSAASTAGRCSTTARC